MKREELHALYDCVTFTKQKSSLEALPLKQGSSFETVETSPGSGTSHQDQYAHQEMQTTYTML